MLSKNFGLLIHIQKVFSCEKTHQYFRTLNLKLLIQKGLDYMKYENKNGWTKDIDKDIVFKFSEGYK